MRTAQVFEAALELPTKERVRLARRLLDTLVEDAAEVDVQQAWQVEIERRVREIREGRADVEDTETVLRELESELTAARRRGGASKKVHRRTR